MVQLLQLGMWKKIPEETPGSNFICMKWTTKTHDEPQSGNQFPDEI